jgi:hypothetical protein
MMKSRTFVAAAGVAAAMACAAVTPIVLPTCAAAQANLTMTNVIPDDSSFAVQGKIQANNAGARTLTIMSASNTPLPMSADPGASIANLEVGDRAAVSACALVLTSIAKCGWFGC